MTLLNRGGNFTPGDIQITRIKVVLVGATYVGKTSIAMRFAENVFQNEYKQTVGASFMTKSMDVGDNRFIFQMWDTAGQERYMSLVPMYMRDVAVALLVYDVTNKESFTLLAMWLKELYRYSNEDTVVAIVGNKTDLDAERDIPKNVGMLFASQHGHMFMETSAKTGENIEKLFENIGVSLNRNLPSVQKERPDSIKIGKTDDKPKRKCCRS